MLGRRDSRGARGRGPRHGQGAAAGTSPADAEEARHSPSAHDDEDEVEAHAMGVSPGGTSPGGRAQVGRAQVGPARAGPPDRRFSRPGRDVQPSGPYSVPGPGLRAESDRELAEERSPASRLPPRARPRQPPAERRLRVRLGPSPGGARRVVRGEGRPRWPPGWRRSPRSSISCRLNNDCSGRSRPTTRRARARRAGAGRP